MQSWKNFSAQLPAVDMSAMSKNLRNTVQATREKLGNVGPDGITELPAEYKQLEARVDGLRELHQKILKIAKVHETESYDYPSDIAESVQDMGQQAASAWSSFANKNLKNTNLPIPIPAQGAPTPHQPKTLPHAMSRAAKAGATELGSGDRLGMALAVYGSAMEKVGDARMSQDQMISEKFVTPWSATLSTSIGLAMKARANVKTARLELDSARAALKSAAPAKQEQARLHVEEAEDKLVQNTETAIGLMKAVLENPEPIQNLSNLVKAQLIFYSSAAETLSGIQGEIDEAATAAEGEYRTSRGA
ncbi:BAR domain-containing family protein [Kockovaella imperatae]|uniref:BAR domain-containing family protein n=1 Tax=Kockovaella imperatae TaxID=4999 RepID=A0A1Y1UD44_9TREE|nr:BAR domain-containing family protein [Kockovaella imperatae]ORX35932.1 BAR domain-containing family protein [Kockovaella imperatae]